MDLVSIVKERAEGNKRDGGNEVSPGVKSQAGGDADHVSLLRW